MRNKPFIVLMDSVGQSSDRAVRGQLVSAPRRHLGSQLENTKAGGYNYLKAYSLMCLGLQFLSISASVWLTLGWRLDYLKAWRLDSKDGVGGGGVWWRSHIPFYDLASEVPRCNFPHILPVESREGKTQASWWVRGELWKSRQGQKYCCGHCWKKYNLSQPLFQMEKQNGSGPTNSINPQSGSPVRQWSG